MKNRGVARPVAAAMTVVVVAILLPLIRAGSPWATDGLPESGGGAVASAPEVATPDGRRGVPPVDAGAAEADGVLTAADGVLPEAITPFAVDHPAIANLDPELLAAVRAAARDAAAVGIQLHINSGWRSAEYQEHLLREAVIEHGSAEAAARWVASVDTSAHVTGDAVDVGPAEARAWLSEHGAAYGLCQTYLNEPWHFELRPTAGREGCPPPYRDATQGRGMSADLRAAPAPPRSG